MTPADRACSASCLSASHGCPADALPPAPPGLAVNQELESFSDGCKLLQVGQQELALGFKFTARCVLDIREHPDGIPGRLLGHARGAALGGERRASAPLDGSFFPTPRSQMGTDAPHADIAFESMQGDFQVGAACDVGAHTGHHLPCTRTPA